MPTGSNACISSVGDTHLSAINYTWIEAICEILGIGTKLSWSMDYELVDGKTERLVGICRQAGATAYSPGRPPAATSMPSSFVPRTWS